ncbi:MAG: hypothetical protein JXB29_13025 [Sedimentisphaerales bacterium]|nr:hypothetical protein [Sedimentisphaerales bacterium]
MNDEMEQKQVEVSDEQVKEKRPLLRFFTGAVQVVGWLLIFWGVMWFIYLASGPDYGRDGAAFEDMEKAITVISGFSFDFVFVGLAAVMLGQLARYVFDKAYRPGLMLRCGEKILYVFAGLSVFWAMWRWRFFVMSLERVEWRVLLGQPLMMPTVAKVLILVCVAQILKRILPVIEEYKTLV